MAWLRDIDRWFIDRVLPHAGSFRRYARRVAFGDQDADDLVQEAYARLLAVDDWRRLESPPHFMLRIIRNLAAERLRRSRVVAFDQASVLDLSNMPDMAPDPFATTASRQELTHLLAAFEKLPEKCRQVVHMRKIQGLAPAEIAEKLGISVSTVEKHLAKGFRLLTEAMVALDDSSSGPVDLQWLQKRVTNDRE